MSDLEQQNFTNKPRNRRAIVKGAAWSVPVIAAAIAAPAASASTVVNTDLGIAFTGASFDLRNNLITGLDTWFNALPLGSRLAAAVAYAALKAGITLGTAVANVGFDYPSALVVSNVGTNVLDAGQIASLSLAYSGDVLNLSVIEAENPTVNLDVLAVGGGSAGTVTAGTAVTAGGVVASVPLRYNPITVEVNLLGGGQVPSSMVGALSGDGNANLNNASTPLGLRLDVLGPLGGLVSAVLGLVGLNELKIPVSIFS
ncbi:hypothetical protein NHF46_04015 [Arthrobacter alpinus]|nr:hypothetical protein [Arthrobacter alpinus]